MNRYDYFIAGRWRNRDEIRKVLDAVRAAGKTAYCFIENSYNSDGIELDATTRKQEDIEKFMQTLETLEDWQTNATFRSIFDKDMTAEREAEVFVLVFPAGLAAHMELGAAYGMGKKCYGIGRPDKYETLYLMFDEVYADVDSFLKAQMGVPA